MKASKIVYFLTYNYEIVTLPWRIKENALKYLEKTILQKIDIVLEKSVIIMLPVPMAVLSCYDSLVVFFS